MKTNVTISLKHKKVHFAIIALTLSALLIAIMALCVEIPPLFAPNLFLRFVPGSLDSSSFPLALVSLPLPISGWIAPLLRVFPGAGTILILLAIILDIAVYRDGLPPVHAQSSVEIAQEEQPGGYLRWATALKFIVLALALFTLMETPLMGWVLDQQGNGNTVLRRVSLISSTEGWAVGHFQSNSNRDFGVIWHYSQGRWEQAPTTVVNEELTDIAALPDGEAWSVGSGGTLLHEQHSAWTAVDLLKNIPRVDRTQTNLFSITMISPTEGWAVGEIQYTTASTNTSISGSMASVLPAFAHAQGTQNIQRSGTIPGTSECLILHYTNGQWFQVACPSHTTVPLEAVTSLPDGEAWAVGKAYTLLHERNGVWTQVQDLDHDQDGDLDDIAMVSPTEGWAIGDNGALLHCQQGQWITLPPTHMHLENITMVSPTEGWIVGDHAVLHYHPGSWQSLPLSADESPLGIAEVPGHPQEFWIVGSHSQTSGAGQSQNYTRTPLLLHGYNSTWHSY